MDALSYSYPYGDRSFVHGFVKLNGIMVWNRFSRGVSILSVDPYACTSNSHRTFDTYASKGEAASLLQYLQQLPVNTVVVGVTGDEPTRYLSTVYGQLHSMGVDVEDVKYRGSFAFVTTVGHPKSTIMAKVTDNTQSAARISCYVEGGEVKFSVICLNETRCLRLMLLPSFNPSVAAASTEVFMFRLDGFGVSAQCEGLRRDR